MFLLRVSAVLLCASSVSQEKSPLATDAQRVIGEIRDGSSKDGGLFKLFGDDYLPSLEWEAGLVPVLLEGLKVDNHSVQFSIDRTWHKVAGFELFAIGGGTFESIDAKSKTKILEWLDKWWAKVKDKSRVDWFLDSLTSPSLTFRRMAIERLSMLFNRSFGFEVEADSDRRTKAADEYRAWWEKAKKLVHWNAEQACYVVDDAKLSDEEVKKAAAEIQSWIDKLSDADWETRELATERLIEAGRLALEPVTAALKSDDPEVRYRAQLVVDAQKTMSKQRDFRAKVDELLRGDIPAAVAELAGKKDLLSAALIVEICDRVAPAAYGSPAAKRAASDPQIAWAFARHIRRSTADVWQGAVAYWPSDAVRALFADDAARLVPYLKDASPRVRMAAAAIIASRGSKQIDDVKAALGDTDKRVRLSAIQAFGQSGDGKASAALQAHYKIEKDWDNRRWIVLAVGRLKDESAVEWLSTVATNRDEQLFVQGAGAEAIGMIGSTKSIPALLKLLDARKGDLEEKKDEYTRNYVIQYITGAIAKIALANAEDKESWKALEAVVAHNATGIRRLAVQAVVYADLKSGAPAARVRELLQPATQDRDVQIRQLAELGLRRWK